MSKRNKELARIRRNKRSVRFEDLDKLLLYYGFERTQPRGGSSHFVYALGQYQLTVARHEPFIHFKTVQEALDILDEVLELE